MPFRSLSSAIRSRPGRHVRWRDLELRTHRTDVGAYRIHWAEAGTGEESVALLHGLSGSARWWARNVQALAARYRVLLPDVVGFGRSRVRRHTFTQVPEIADVLSQWLAAAAGGPANLVGHSLGGHLSIHIATRNPERVKRLALVDATGIPRPLTPRHVMRFAYDVAPPRQWGDPTFLPIIFGDVLSAGPFTTLRALKSLLWDDVRPLLSAISVPTLLIWGEHDAFVPVSSGAAMREAIPNARLLVLRGAYHNPMVDHPEAFNAGLLAFLGGEETGE
ncbi:MAG TPA: alpha/beta hydrolase [Longimicrobium sp.]|nr:alpha/beta hydrolase [Longimicrobium sp.]